MRSRAGAACCGPPTYLCALRCLLMRAGFVACTFMRAWFRDIVCMLLTLLLACRWTWACVRAYRACSRARLLMCAGFVTEMNDINSVSRVGMRMRVHMCHAYPRPLPRALPRPCLLFCPPTYLCARCVRA